MNRQSFIIRGIFSALLIQAVSLVSATAQRSNVPSSVSKLDSASHSLVDSYQSELRSHGHHNKLPRNEARFLQAAKNLESSAHSLSSVIEKKLGYDRAKYTLNDVIRASDALASASREVRLDESTRRQLSRVRTLVDDVDHDSRLIYAAASPRKGNNDHGHDHDHHDDHDHNKGKGRDNDRGPRLPGILGKIFNN